MTEAALILLFPFVPLFAAVAALALHSLVRRDISIAALRGSAAAQTAVGLALIVRFLGVAGEVRRPISLWNYAIEFAFDSSRTPFLMAYLCPLLFSLSRLRQLTSPSLRLAMLFYLGGCSGLLVTGDVFNFFVFYELMIMAAYVLVAARGRFYASVKYMLLGAISSCFLLAGIIAFYATGADLGIPFAPEFYARPVAHQAWVYTLFATAFFIKSAFFPVHSWVATCHAASVPMISAFLGSYTVFTGIYGLYQRVLRPAAVTGFVPIFDWLETLALLTMLVPSAAVFLEKDFKRCIAGSTVVTMGFVGLLLARGYPKAATFYVALHAVYKSLLFHLTDDLVIAGGIVQGRGRTLAALAVAAWMASGFFPAVIWFLKYDLIEAHAGLRAAALISSAFVAGGFLKFRYARHDAAPRTALPVAGLMALFMVAASFPWYRPVAAWKVMLELSTLATIVWLAERWRRQEGGWRWTWEGRLFPNLNVELLMPLLLFVSGLAFVVARRL